MEGGDGDSDCGLIGGGFSDRGTLENELLFHCATSRCEGVGIVRAGFLQRGNSSISISEKWMGSCLLSTTAEGSSTEDC